VTWGRLTGYLWLRLQRKGNEFTGSSSIDGKTWTTIGTASVPLRKNLFVGLPVSSGIKTVSTTVRFDKVIASK
jgi:regulation of enolase protein 1 (concanavalin A-like superfamily)